MAEEYQGVVIPALGPCTKMNSGGRGDGCTTKISVRCLHSALKSQEASHVIFKNPLINLCLSFSHWKIKTVAASKYAGLEFSWTKMKYC